MDSLTQIVLGASVAEVTLGKKVGNKAMLWGAIAGTIPDLDVLAKQFTDIVSANEMHRGVTHSILFSIVMSPIFGWMISKLYRKSKKANWKQWSWLFFWSFITHPLLDAHTTWGTQLFWPLDIKVSYQNIFVADPLYTLPFLVCTAAAMFYKRTNPKRVSWNRLGIILSSSYMLITIVLKGYTYFKFKESLNQQEIEYNEISTRPTPLNSVLWTANVDADSSYYIGYYSILDSEGEIKFNRLHKNREEYKSLLKEEIVQRLIKLCRGWYLIEKTSDGYAFNDLRFGMLTVNAEKADFVFCYDLKYVNGKLTVEQRDPKMQAGSEMLQALIKRIKGN